MSSCERRSTLIEQDIVFSWNGMTPDERRYWGDFPRYRMFYLLMEALHGF
jgi:hypothetical protein